MDPITMEASLDAPLDLVWRAWTETERMTEWFAPAANIVAEEGGAFELFFDPADHSRMSTIGCVITAIEPMTKLAFTWKGPDQFAGLMNEHPLATSVEVRFEDERGCTRIRVEHRGWGEGDEWGEAREWHIRAWEGVFDSLRSGFESNPGLLRQGD